MAEIVSYSVAANDADFSLQILSIYHDSLQAQCLHRSNLKSKFNS